MVHSQIGPANPIAAHSPLTGIGAGIVVQAIAIIAGFVFFHLLVATNGCSAIVGAIIKVVPVTVIAILFTGSNHFIATAGQYASVQAAIAVDIVAVIAGFFPGQHKTVTTAGQGAGIGAAIGLHPVAIVAGFIAGSAFR